MVANSGTSRRIPGGFHNSSGDLVLSDSHGVLIGNVTKSSIGGTESMLEILGTSAPDASIGIGRWQNNANGAFVSFVKSRGTEVGSSGVPQNLDAIGTLHFHVDDGTDLISKSADVYAEVDGVVGEDDTPGALVFRTTPSGSASPTERLRINSDGNLEFQQMFESVWNEFADGIASSGTITKSLPVRWCGTVTTTSRTTGGGFMTYRRYAVMKTGTDDATITQLQSHASVAGNAPYTLSVSGDDLVMKNTFSVSVSLQMMGVGQNGR